MNPPSLFFFLASCLSRVFVSIWRHAVRLLPRLRLRSWRVGTVKGEKEPEVNHSSIESVAKQGTRQGPSRISRRFVPNLFLGGFFDDLEDAVLRGLLHAVENDERPALAGALGLVERAVADRSSPFCPQTAMLSCGCGHV